MFYRQMRFAISLVGACIFSSNGSAQTTEYFSDFEEGSVIRNVGREVVASDCKLERAAFIDIVAQEIAAANWETEMSADQFAQVILGNLKLRKQVEWDGKTLVFTGIDEC